jgi:hypothetical protein
MDTKKQAQQDQQIKYVTNKIWRNCYKIVTCVIE